MTSHGVLGLRRPVPTFGDPIADALSSPAGKSLIYGISVFLRFVLHLLLSAHALLDSVISTAHDRLCGLLALPPCDVHDPRESAVLIAGGDDGEYSRMAAPRSSYRVVRHARPIEMPMHLLISSLYPARGALVRADIGRPAAFSFSQLGYTVFVLCPDKPPAPLVHADAGANVSSSSVSAQIAFMPARPLNPSLRHNRCSPCGTLLLGVAQRTTVPCAPPHAQLIQEWHQRIKRSPGSPGAPWGLVAPIVLDMSSRAQRTRAFETVDAYCSTHHLRLVAALVLPPPRSGGPDAGTYERPRPSPPRRVLPHR